MPGIWDRLLRPVNKNMAYILSPGFLLNLDGMDSSGRKSQARHFLPNANKCVTLLQQCVTTDEVKITTLVNCWRVLQVQTLCLQKELTLMSALLIFLPCCPDQMSSGDLCNNTTSTEGVFLLFVQKTSGENTIKIKPTTFFPAV